MINTTFSPCFTIFGSTDEPAMLWQCVLFYLEVQFLYEETYAFENERVLFIYFLY